MTLKLSDLEAMERAATAGEWLWHEDWDVVNLPEHSDDLDADKYADLSLTSEYGEHVIPLGIDHRQHLWDTHGGNELVQPSRHDRALIAASRNALPKLLEIARAAIALRDMDRAEANALRMLEAAREVYAACEGVEL